MTTQALVPLDKQTTARLVARGAGVAAGVAVARALFRLLDADLDFGARIEDGGALAKDTVIAELRGRAGPMLTAERTALNFLQRLSGIATLTARFVAAVEGTAARIYDTRKTTPGWRALEKHAVRMGGGCNHRFGLFDQVLIKDNHIAFCRDLSLPDIIERTRRAAAPGTRIEIEVDSLEQLRAALPAHPDIILIDNMNVETAGDAVRIVRAETSPERRPQIEASGGITLGNVRAYALSGVDRISIGALTHSAPALDVALDL